jgi:hypothetical protein
MVSGFLYSVSFTSSFVAVHVAFVAAAGLLFLSLLDMRKP